MDENLKKNPLVENEEKTLKFWRENSIFEKSLAKESPKGEFVFYEGPPTANGRPGIHHLEARAFKDAIPRYKTMQGFHVRRKGGWDTHGLPVELAVEKELGLKSKKEIEVYGIEAFNKKCKESVWKFVSEWEEFTQRIGYWVDLKNPYVTYKPEYIESVWNIVSKINEQGLLYKDYKVVPWCPRCGTGLSSHELAQGYEDVKDLSVTTKFKVKSEKFKSKDGEETYLLAWTTTPWTLPGNVGLAVGEKITYQLVVSEGLQYIVAKERAATVFKEKTFEVVQDISGKELIGLEYEPLYPFLKDNLSETEKPKLANAFKVYPANFVTTTDGTGIVHTAVMYGTDDFELGNKVGLPKHHLVKEDGTFKEEVGFLAGKFVKPARTTEASVQSGGDEGVDILIIKDLAGRGLLFSKEKYSHSYPHCWRCHTPLIYFARDSWYIKMSALREKLLSENEKINWEPDYIKHGRFGEWLKDVKDWAISRERYWGTPLPVWKTSATSGNAEKYVVIGSIADLKKYAKKSGNTYFVMRHGESVHNLEWRISTTHDNREDCLTEKGKAQALASAQTLKDKKIDMIVVSPFKRTRETSEIVREALGLSPEKVTLDERLHEIGVYSFEGKTWEEYHEVFPKTEEYFTAKRDGDESYLDAKIRMMKVLYEYESKYQGKNILFVTHGGPGWLLNAGSHGLSLSETYSAISSIDNARQDGIKNAEIRELDFVPLPHNENYELDLHRPFIDAIELIDENGAPMTRAKEVMDVWFDSGAMPFAQDADLRRTDAESAAADGKKSWDDISYPADFISEAIDQTRGWFYTLHAIGVLTGKGRAYKNVICLGHILDAEGKKMSKSVGNVVDPHKMIEKYGADPLRFWMYSVNQPGEPKNFDEKTVDEIVKKVFNLTSNVLTFYQLYAETEHGSQNTEHEKQISNNVLDQWILTRLNQLVAEVTTSLNSYKLLEPTRAIRDFIADLSQWYLRRSRDRFKGEDEADKNSALQTTNYVLLTLAKVMAPFTPFFADFLYKGVEGKEQSVHLEKWPEESLKFKVEGLKVLEQMEEVRKIVSLGLEQRAKAGIKVRQPLQKLKIKSEKLKISDKDFLGLVKDEVNVKEVVIDLSLSTEVELDLNITPELKEEGSVREFVRAIQDLRKTSGFNPGELAELTVDADEKTLQFLQKYEKDLIKSTQLKKIQYASVSGGTEVSLEEAKVKISISK
ncbi:MAG: class I tRNA ligase family protein [Patescibacteria group bacterium]